MKHVHRALFLLTAVVAIAAAVWGALGFVSPPWLVNRSGGSYAIFDREGKLMRLTLASDERYRVWVPLERMPKELIDATLLQEDRWFGWHPGVNPYSLLRGSFTTYIGGDRRVGGSTLTMQLARQRLLLNTRTVGGKLSQMYHALVLERHFTKDQILEAYLNTVPYGSNIEGVGAASLVYFGKSVSQLSLPEILSLVVIPQSPAARTPFSERGRAALGIAQGRLAGEWAKNAASGSGDAAARQMLRAADLRVSTRRELPRASPHLPERMAVAGHFPGEIRSSIDSGTQRLIEQQLRQFLRRNDRLGMRNGAAILIDYRSMAVRAYVGSADWGDARIEGQVNGLRGKRSPGSTLKPFIYGLALDQGVIHPETVLKDTALRISEYNPENFERDFIGPISATEALVRSRNVPAIALANQLKGSGLYGLLRAAGVSKLKSERHYGLAVALGGVELTMEELVSLYAALANGGVVRPLVFEEGMTSAPGNRLLSAEASYLVIEMLRNNPRPSFEYGPVVPPTVSRIPWKTGTSFGFRDAWSVGIVGPYVLGVWVGNFDGTPNPNFIGRDAAGPLFFAIVDALRTSEILSESVVQRALNIKKVSVCSVSGALPGPHCRKQKDAWFIPGVSPIHTCSVHREVKIDPSTGLRACAGNDENARSEVFEFWPSDILQLYKAAGITRRTPPQYSVGCRLAGRPGVPPLISSPQARIRYAIRRDLPAEVSFSAVTDGDSSRVYWFVDDAFVGSSQSGEPFHWNAKPGSFVVRAVDDRGRSNSQTISVEQLPG